MKRWMIIILMVCVYASCGKRPLCYWDHPHSGVLVIHHDWSGVFENRKSDSVHYCFYPLDGTVLENNDYVDLDGITRSVFRRTTGSDSIEKIKLPPGVYNMYGRTNTKEGRLFYQGSEDLSTYCTYLNTEVDTNGLTVMPQAEILNGSWNYSVLVKECDTSHVYVKHLPLTERLTVSIVIDGMSDIVGCRAFVGGLARSLYFEREQASLTDLGYTEMKMVMTNYGARGAILILDANPNTGVENYIKVYLEKKEGGEIVSDLIDVTDLVDNIGDNLRNQHKGTITLRVVGRSSIDSDIEIDPWKPGEGEIIDF